MPVLFQKMIFREDLRRNHDVLYVFGDNVMRKGMGGQAAEMRGEPNGVGVATKYAPSMAGSAFFDEDPASTEAQKRILDEDMKRLFEHVKTGGIVVWPSNGIGTERAKLALLAPSTWDYLQQKLGALIKTAKLFERRIAT